MFYDCDGLRSITIPNTVKTIGTWSFSSCDALKTLEILGSETIGYILPYWGEILLVHMPLGHVKNCKQYILRMLILLEIIHLELLQMENIPEITRCFIQ